MLLSKVLLGTSFFPHLGKKSLTLKQNVAIRREKTGKKYFSFFLINLEQIQNVSTVRFNVTIFFFHRLF